MPKIIFLFVCIYFLNYFSILIFNHILFTKLLIFLAILILFKQRIHIKKSFFGLFLFPLLYMMFIYWQLPVYSFIHIFSLYKYLF